MSIGRAADATSVLAEIINAVLRAQHFSRQWRTADIIMLLNVNKDWSLPGSYRSISFVSNLSKVAEGFYRLLEAIRDGPSNREMMGTMFLHFATVSGLVRLQTRPVVSGVPQGLLFGPDLYIVFTHDLFREIGTSLAVYADDRVDYTSCRNEAFVHRRFQRDMDGLTVWASELTKQNMWQLILSAEEISPTTPFA